MTMTTRDGIPVNNGRSTPGSALIYTTTFASPDLIEQVRVIVSPADASWDAVPVRCSCRPAQARMNFAAPCSGQTAMLFGTRALPATTLGPSEELHQPQPVWRPHWRTRHQEQDFFLFLYEGQRRLEKQSIVTTVLTDPARQGTFRYFTGRQNGNFTAATSVRS